MGNPPLPVLPAGRTQGAVLSQEPRPPMAELVPRHTLSPTSAATRTAATDRTPNDHSRNSAGGSTRVVAGRPGVATPTPVGTAEALTQRVEKTYADLLYSQLSKSLPGTLIPTKNCDVRYVHNIRYRSVCFIKSCCENW